MDHRSWITLIIIIFLLSSLFYIYGCSEPSSLEETIPSTPKIGDFPLITKTDRLTIFGTKDPETDIRLNGREIISFNSLTKWSYDLSLKEGENIFLITSMDEDLNEGEPLRVEIILDITPPLSPTINSVTSPTDISFQLISGNKEHDSSILINNEIVVENNPDTEWSYLLPLRAGKNEILISSRDIVGNESSPIQTSIDLTVTPPPSTILLYPANNERTRNTLPTFEWLSFSDIDIDRYIFQFSRSADFSSLLINPEPEVPIPIYSIFPPLENGTYYWRIGLRDPIGNISYSKTRRIIIGRIANDINGDGYSDIIIGAPFVDSGGSDSGEAYIFWGGDPMDEIPDVILTVESEGGGFGYSVAIAGDLNRDGYDDIAVGSIFNDRGGIDSGRVYIFWGGDPMDEIPDVILTGESEGDGFGYSISGVGDINNDGFDDIIIGAPFKEEGVAYIYLGGLYMDDTPDLIITGERSEDGFGFSTGYAGDVNNDDYSDVIVGAPFNDTNGDNAGRSYIYLGGQTIDDRPDIIMRGLSSGDQFGFSVSGAGDINRDGLSDVLIGAIRADGVRPDFGMAYLYLGGALMDNEVDIVFSGEASFNFFGHVVSTAGDLNNDGFDDIIISAPYNDSGGFDAGRVYVYWGGEEMDDIADIIITGRSRGDLLGYSAAPAFDTNGDGDYELIIGAPLSDIGGRDRGEALIYMGGATMDWIPDMIFSGIASSDNFGFSVR